MAITNVVTLKAFIAIVAVLVIETVLILSQSFQTRTGDRMQGMYSKVAKSSNH